MSGRAKTAKAKVRAKRTVGRTPRGKPKTRVAGKRSLKATKRRRSKGAGSPSVPDKAPARNDSRLRELERLLAEAAEQRTATSEILRIISQFPHDVQPVFDTIANAALKLCGASAATVTTFDGELVRMAAIANVDQTGTEALRRQFPRPASRDTAATRAIFTRSVVSIPDVLEDPDFGIQSAALASGFRSVLGVPLMRDGTPIGAIALGRPKPGPFPET